MKQTLSFAVVGGDFRQVILSELLAQDGHAVTLYANERKPLPMGVQLGACEGDAFAHDMIVLPMPLSRDQTHLNAPLSNTSIALSALFTQFPPHALVVGGAISAQVHALATQHSLRLLDLLDREQLAILNAVPTVEGALQIAMEELPITLHGARVLVIGNGRIGALLAQKLQGLGARVSVSARCSADFARIACHGYQALDSRNLTAQLHDFQLLINTVPACILGERELSCVAKDCLLLDLASGAGGIDQAAAHKQQLRLIHALSLPGRVAPVSAARAIYTTLDTLLHEEDML